MNGCKDTLGHAGVWAASGLLVVMGGWDVWLVSIISLRVFDWISGAMRALVERQSFSREKFIMGWAITLGYFIAISVAVIMDRLLECQGYATRGGIRLLTCTYISGREIFSIYENLGAIGLRFPKAITHAFNQLTQRGEDES